MIEETPEAVSRSSTAGQREAGDTQGRKLTPSVPATSEAAFQKQVIEIAHYHGWTCAHFAAAPTQTGRWSTPVKADGKGFPDLVLVRERVIYAELKTERGQVRPQQKVWAKALIRAGQEMYLWRPRDLGEIQKVLT